MPTSEDESTSKEEVPSEPETSDKVDRNTLEVKSKDFPTQEQLVPASFEEGTKQDTSTQYKLILREARSLARVLLQQVRAGLIKAHRLHQHQLPSLPGGNRRAAKQHHLAPRKPNQENPR